MGTACRQRFAPAEEVSEEEEEEEGRKKNTWKASFYKT